MNLPPRKPARINSVVAILTVGLGISFCPYIVPPEVTIWDAAAPQSSLAFMLVGAVVIGPIILAYTY